jgi:hypothetical protein
MSRNGPRTELCGTPRTNVIIDEQHEPRCTHSVRPLRYEVSQASATLEKPNDRRSRSSKTAWSMVLNAVDKSSTTTAAKSPRSTAVKMSDVTRSMAVSVEKPGRKPVESVGAGQNAVDSPYLASNHALE